MGPPPLPPTPLLLAAIELSRLKALCWLYMRAMARSIAANSC
jgi:hypothetical protein